MVSPIKYMRKNRPKLNLAPHRRKIYTSERNDQRWKTVYHIEQPHRVKSYSCSCLFAKSGRFTEHQLQQRTKVVQHAGRTSATLGCRYLNCAPFLHHFRVSCMLCLACVSSLTSCSPRFVQFSLETGKLKITVGTIGFLLRIT